jgi:hypothetical protein
MEKMMSRSERLNNKEQFRSWVRGLLSEGIVTVSFTKKDGTERVMNCTTNGIHIPVDKQPKAQVHETNTEDPVNFPKAKAKSVDAYAVFDIDKQEWRSFRWADVNQVSFSLGEYNTKGEYNGLVE